MTWKFKCTDFMNKSIFIEKIFMSGKKFLLKNLRSVKFFAFGKNVYFEKYFPLKPATTNPCLKRTPFHPSHAGEIFRQKEIKRISVLFTPKYLLGFGSFLH